MSSETPETTSAAAPPASLSNLFGDDLGSSSDDDSASPPTTDNPNMPPPPPSDISGTIQLKDYPGMGGGKEMVYTRLPNVVAVQPAEYNEEIYDPTEEKQTVRYTSSIIRWRYAQTPDGKPVRDPNTNSRLLESNTRLTTWSDNSQTLTVGSEHFEILPSSTPSIYLMQIQNASSKTILQSTSSIPKKLTVRPLSLDSESHKSLALEVKRRNMKKSRIVLTTTSHDPEKMKEQKARSREDVINHKRRKNYSKSSGLGMSKDYLEGGDIGDIRKQALEGGVDFGDDSSEEEDNGWAESKARKRSKRGQEEEEAEMEDSDEEEMVVVDDKEEEEEDEEEVVTTKKGKKKAIVDDDDE
ncbi:hypothetical protein TrLO_g597 [Triparma laevis f. longispina]|uniref:RNA polymerase-associated protein LEO1 n=1 Tax=Triparma laevis f. longispina TaxID=1714387 RepID=A0A9W7A0S4_9STRA|nr:hypothetical protein TrLO_g597 [Triparma laevis f. longispina]